MKKKKKKIIEEEKDYSFLTYIFVFILLAGAMVFMMYYGSNKSKQIKASQQEQVTTIEETKPEPVEAPTIGTNIPSFETYNYKLSFEINTIGTVKDFLIQIPIPSDESERQYITESSLSIPPNKIYFNGSTKYIEYNFPELKNEKKHINIEGKTNIRTYDLKTAKLINKNHNPEKNLNRYLTEEKYIEVNDPQIKSTAAKISGNTKEEQIQNIYEFVQNHLTYKHIAGISGAKKALIERVGECSEYSALMVALCRAKGIPARMVSGNIARNSNTKHSWVEIYFDEFGWVTFDPTTMPVIVNIYQNGKLIRQEKKLNSAKGLIKYISSGKNIFSPYSAKYKMDNTGSGKAIINESITIKKQNN